MVVGPIKESALQFQRYKLKTHYLCPRSGNFLLTPGDMNAISAHQKHFEGLNHALAFLTASHHSQPFVPEWGLENQHRPMRAFFRSVSASFSTTFCFWAAMRSFVFSLSLEGKSLT